MRIEGDEEFTQRTLDAIGLLSPLPEFERIKPYIHVIKQAERSGMFAYYPEPTLEVGEKTWRHSPEWYASVIAHDSHHSLLYWTEWHRLSGETPGRDVWTGAEAERKCLEFQMRVLKKVAKNSWDVQYLQRVIDSISIAAEQQPVLYEQRYW
jgi:hypothetical protein